MINSEQQQQNDSLILLLSDLDKICLDAYLFNSANKLNAYKVCKGITDSNIDESTLNARANKWLNNRGNMAYLDKHKTAILSYETSSDCQSVSNNFDKEAIVHQISVLINSTNDTKLKSELLIKLADLNGYKKETTKQQDVIRYYLPLRCDSCEFKPK